MNQAAEANEAWVLTLPAASAVTVAALRLFPGLEIGVAEDLLWLRGDRADDDLRGRLLGLPATARYRQAPDRRLRPEGSRLATRKTPPLSWRPLREWARVQPPPAGLPPSAPSPVTPGLVRATGAERPANARLLDFDVWRDWALSAPEARLTPLIFAATGERALVRGLPLPAAPGRYFVETDGLIAPAGMEWRPALPAAVLRRAWRAGDGDVILWDESGARILGRELFVPATRANVRATERAIREAKTA